MIAALLLSAARPALAVSGRIVDEAGEPVPGARACLRSGHQDAVCTQADETGYYRLEDALLTTVRITAPGYLPEEVAAVDQEAPVVLRRSATLFVRVVDPAGEPLAGGTIRIVLVSGRQIDGLPFNRAGVRVADLAPGTLTVRASLAGWEEVDPPTVEVVAGQQTDVVVRLRRP
jgi:hypothetical protein